MAIEQVLPQHVTGKEYFEQIREMAFTEAIRKGCKVVISSPKQIQLDLDTPWIHASNHVDGIHAVLSVIHQNDIRKIILLSRFLENFSVVEWQAWKSSGGNSHVMLTLTRELSLSDRICLQSILGSDPMRELLNFRRMLCNADDPVALFRPSESV